MHSPAISVIVPVYNTSIYLRICLDSIIKQSFKDFELIIVNDGSTDDSDAICRDYATTYSFVHYIAKENGGLSSARNSGLDVAKGKFVTFVDSDDILENDALHNLYNVATRYNSDITIGRCVRFNKNGDLRPYNTIETEKLLKPKLLLKKVLEGRGLNISVCGGIYKMHLFENIRFPLETTCEDWYITPRLFFTAESAVVTWHPWYMYRDNENSTMGTMKSSLVSYDVINVCSSVLDDIKEEDLELYRDTLWFNLRRVWKWIGITYKYNTYKENINFHRACRLLLSKHLYEIYCSPAASTRDKIAVLLFCKLPRVSHLLFRLKY